MDFNTYFQSFQIAYDEAIQNIIELREQAQEIKENMETIIDACENIENEF